MRSWLFHRLVATPTQPEHPPHHDSASFDHDDASAERFFSRFGSELELRGKSVLDIGCGTGSVCIEAAMRGAPSVVGIDMQLIDVARERLQTCSPEVVEKVEFLATDGSLAEIAGRQFDTILSKDSFEHYDDPENFVHVMTGFLRPGGELAIGFGPLWKSPAGGHIDFMTRLPWAHLIFPEAVIMAERRRFRPDEDAERFGDVIGGLNKITCRRFEQIMAASGLECQFLESNVSPHPAMRAMKAVSRVPPLREYFTNNIYTIWRKPLEGEQPRAQR